MKTLQTLLIGLAFMAAGSTQAQVSVSLNMNIGTPPAWAPPVQTEVRYYYLPEINTYYDVSTRHYIYINRGQWIRNAYLPAPYRGYNLYRGPKVVVANYYGRTPYTYYKPHKVYKKHHKAPKHHGHHGNYHARGKHY